MAQSRLGILPELQACGPHEQRTCQREPDAEAAPAFAGPSSPQGPDITNETQKCEGYERQHHKDDQ